MTAGAKLGARATKAYLGAAIAGLATLGTAVADEHLTWAEGIGVLGTVLSAFAAIYLAPNGADADPTTSTPEVDEPGPDSSRRLGL